MKTGTEGARGRAFAMLFLSSAISTTGFLTANTATSLVAEDLLGSAALAGVPAAAGVLGTAAGANWLAGLILRASPRNGLTIGYLLAALGASSATSAVVLRSFPLFVTSMFVFGVGFGSNRLARYVAADLFSPARRGTVIGWIVWASTIGAAIGPMLLAPAVRLAESLHFTGLSGAYAVCSLALMLSALAMLASRRDAYPAAPAGGGRRALAVGPLLGHVRGNPGATLAAVTMVTGQFVMVLIMTVTPLHARHAGSTLTGIGIIITAHTLGMYALSPVTGLLADRVGRIPVIVAAVVLLVVSALVGVASGGSHARLILALLLLGIGWNFGFVSGSALLTDSVGPAERVRIQGLVDAMVWGFGAVASVSSGFMLERWGFVALCGIGAVLALVPLATIPRFRAPLPVGSEF